MPPCRIHIPPGPAGGRLIARNNFRATALGFNGTPAFATGPTLYADAPDKATLSQAIATARAES
ncbi:hypothetical protein [Sagittula salina]|uniref:Uncharacterized protein n=1 Tax=Sagittula salina TaxID=2820268 RepID=A0A940MPC7_9RHOB|nr:hypothetical protein [Sagittula salina]MBP0482452.1 hypothetical protein [Sagittula salina]